LNLEPTAVSMLAWDFTYITLEYGDNQVSAISYTVS
jgi:hypothetical protein